MRKYFNYLFVATNIVFFSSCSNGQNLTNKQLSATEFQTLLQNSPNATLVDVRTPEEFSKGHLKNALNIDWNGADFEKNISLLDKSAPIFIYCLSGGRSLSAVNKMQSLGFINIIELNGGITQWRRNNLSEISNITSRSTGISRYEFDSLLDTDKLVLINFYAKWCAPCKIMTPYLDELKSEMKDKLVIIRIDADDNQFIFKELDVEAIPTLLLYKNQKLEWSKSGFISKEDLIKLL